MVWLGAGLAALVAGAAAHQWLLVLVGLASLWYGIVWADVARRGRRLTIHEALTPWWPRR
jgi:hypothetical protein